MTFKPVPSLQGDGAVAVTWLLTSLNLSTTKGNSATFFLDLTQPAVIVKETRFDFTGV